MCHYWLDDFNLKNDYGCVWESLFKFLSIFNKNYRYLEEFIKIIYDFL